MLLNQQAAAGAGELWRRQPWAEFGALSRGAFHFLKLWRSKVDLSSLLLLNLSAATSHRGADIIIKSTH